MSKRLKIGDVIEVPTSKGLSYIQYTHTHKDPPQYGDIVRVLEGFCESKPENSELQKIVCKNHRFSAFFPLKEAVREGIFHVVGNFDIPSFAQSFPTFKGTNQYDDPDPEDIVWWLWDGKKEWKAGKLSFNRTNEIS